MQIVYKFFLKINLMSILRQNFYKYYFCVQFSVYIMESVICDYLFFRTLGECALDRNQILIYYYNYYAGCRLTQSNYVE